MDPNFFRFLIFLFLVNLVFQLARRLREPFVDPFYNVLLLADALLCGYGFFSGDQHSVWSLLGVVIFMGAVFIPGLFGLFTQIALKRTDWKWALRFARLRHLFAPTRDARLQVEHIERLEKAHLGNVEELERDLAEEIARAKEPQRRLLQETLVELLAFSGQWRRCLDAYQKLHPDPENPEISRPTLAVALIRASLELGDVQRAWRFYGELRRFEPSDPAMISALLAAEIMFLAVYGNSEALERALYPAHRPHPLFTIASKRYFLGLACLQEGNRQKAAQYLDFPEKLENENPVMGRLARERLALGSMSLDLPSPEQQAELRLMAERVPKLFLRFGGTRPAVATGLFLAIMLAAFAAQLLLGGAEDVWTLFCLGANFRSLILQEPERLVLAMFLHAGVLHIVLNALMLYMFGRQLEMHFGFLRTFSVLVFSGIAGNAASAIVYREGVSVGASSAVFGILGATLMLFVVVRDMWPPSFRRKQIHNLVFLLLLNLVLGFSIPMIDNAAHVGGFVSGSFLGWLFLVLGARTPARRAVARGMGILALLLVAAAAFRIPVLDVGSHTKTVSWEQNGHRVSVRVPVFWEPQAGSIQNIACRLMPTFTVFFVPREAPGSESDDDFMKGFLDSYVARQADYRLEKTGERPVEGFAAVVDFRFHFQGRPGKETMFIRMFPEGLWALRFVHDSSCEDSVEPFMEDVADSFRAERITR